MFKDFRFKNFLLFNLYIFTLSCSIFDTNVNLKNEKELRNSFSIKSSNYDDKAWIPVPFQSQFETGINKNNWCCGLASVNMGTAFLNGKNPTAGYLTKMYKYLGKDASCYNKKDGLGTNQEQQLIVAKEVGNTQNSYNANLSFDELKNVLKKGNPVVVGLKYSFITNRCSSFNGYHSVIVIGYNGKGSYWVVNDPICSSASSGLNKRISSLEFRNATQSWSNQYGYSSGIYGTILNK